MYLVPQTPKRLVCFTQGKQFQRWFTKQGIDSGDSRILTTPTKPSTADYKNHFRLTSPATAKGYIQYSDKFMSRYKENNKNDIYVYPDFIDESEHDLLVKNCEKKLKRLSGGDYAQGHFDKRIHNYRECSVSSWLPKRRGVGAKVAEQLGKPVDPDPIDLPDRSNNSTGGWTTLGKYDGKIRHILDRVWNLFPNNYAWLPPHILDLHENGEILPHVDNPDYSGLVVGGLCLLGPAISTFKHVDDPECRVDVLLNPKCLYFMTGCIRYEFTHEITTDPKQRIWLGKEIDKARRISLMFRDAKEPKDGWKSLAAQSKTF